MKNPSKAHMAKDLQDVECMSLREVFMPIYLLLYRFRILAAVVIAIISICLFSASLTMDVLKSSDVLVSIYPEDINDYASRMAAEELFQDELLGQLTDKIYLERYSICSLILALAIYFLPSPVIVKRNRVLLVFLYFAIPVSIVISEVLVTSINLDRMLYPTWADNILISWLVSCVFAFAVCLILLPLLILGCRKTGGLIFRSRPIQVLSGTLLAIWMVGFACSFFSGEYKAMLPLWLGFVFFYYVLSSSDEKAPIKR
ncbi:hypothetical protein ACQUHX_11160 [Pseudomonas aeruginosa]